MTVPVQVLAAVRSIPHPRQETTVSEPRTANAWNWGGVDMTPAPDLSPAEAARVAEFEAAPEPPEIVVERVARAIASEAIAVTLVTDDEWDFYLRPDEQEDYRRLATAALAALRGDRG